MILEVLFALYEIEHFLNSEITLMRVARFLLFLKADLSGEGLIGCFYIPLFF